MKSSPRHMRVRLFLLIITLSVSPALGQTIDFSDSRLPLTDLVGPWRFQTGDDPAWADPSYDDSRWRLLSAGKSWSQQGYSGYSGVGWYRLRVTLPAQIRSLGIFLPGTSQSCQIFANGRLLGELGKLPPDPAFYLQYNRFFEIPVSSLQSGRPLQLAIRVWLDPRYAGEHSGGLTSIPRLGDSGQLQNWRQLQIHDTFWHQAAAVSDVSINLFTALAGIGLFLLRRREREYLWWGISQAFWALFVAIALAAHFFPMKYTLTSAASILAMGIATYLQVIFYVVFLRQRRGWFFWGASVCVLLVTLIPLSVLAGIDQTPALQSTVDLFAALAQACIVGILWMGERRRDPDAPLLLIPNCVMLAAGIMRLIARLPQTADQPWAAWMHSLFAQAITWPFNVGAFQIIGDLEMLAVLVILFRRYARSRQEEERLEAELEAARAVQKVLIPSEIPSIPGFAVDTVYRPASQVGGDFFQVIPLSAGGALIAIGDVSGKGMPAAMTVSLLVGTLRTLAWYTQSPGDILAAMNRRMLARSHGGFTTCLVLRLEVDGSILAANAGHIAPYLDGQEIEIENGLPLGLDESARYPETNIHLQNHRQLTLLTDGVVEARNASGELLGFDRTRLLSTEPAQQVAQAAQSFGQEDDITVLTLSMAPATVAA
jgi:hypothetical protein